MPWRTVRRALALLAVLTATLTPSLLPAQSVRGVVRRGTTALPGVVVQLLDSVSAVVARTLSDDRGAYRLLAPRAGSYRLATRRIGFVPSVSAPLRLRDGETLEQMLQVDGIAVSLDTVRVSTNRRSCALADGSNTANALANAMVAATWEQARTSLMATEASLAGRAISAALLNYQRTRDRDGRMTLQALTMTEMDSVAQPWTSVSWNELQKTGYIVAAKDTTAFRAPGLDVLISNEFAAAHCFRVVATTDSTQIALAFEPAKSRRNIAELKGTLTLDRRTAELRSLDFGYTNIQALLDEAGAGGRMEFVALRDGSWAIGRWVIRMPVIGQRTDAGRARVRFTPVVTSTEIGGGDLLVARRGTDTLWSRVLPPVTGIVTDSASRLPVVGARLRLRDTDRATVSDTAGRFVFTGVLPGDYSMYVNTPSLDSIGAVTAVPLLVADTVATLAVKVPNARRVLPLVCALSADSLARRHDFGVVRGLVTLAEGATRSAPIEITVQWTDSATRAVRTRRTPADEALRFRVCDVPLGTTLVVQAASAGLSSGSTTVQVTPASPYGLAAITVDALAPDQAVIAGTVVDASGAPLENVTVSITALGLTTVTDATGAFRLTRVAPGPQQLAVRRVGFAPLDVPVSAVAGPPMGPRITLTRVATLEAMTTTASRAWMRDFEEHRRTGLGHFYTREDLAKQEAQKLSAVLVMTPGVKMVTDRRGRKFVSSNRGPRSLSGGGTCYAQVFLDAKPIYLARAGEEPPNIDEFLVSQAEAIEYFASPAQTPAPYNGLNSVCGVLVIHTRQSN